MKKALLVVALCVAGAGCAGGAGADLLVPAGPDTTLPAAEVSCEDATRAVAEFTEPADAPGAREVAEQYDAACP